MAKDKTKKKKRDRATKKFSVSAFIVIICLIVLIVFSYAYLKRNKTTPSAVDTKAAAPESLKDKNAVGGEGSTKYNKDLVEKGKKESDKAKKEGRSYIPPVVEEKKDNGFSILEKKKKRFEQKRQQTAEPEPKKEVKAVKTRERTRPVRQTNSQPPQPVNTERENALKQAIKAEMSQIMGKREYVAHATEVYGSDESVVNQANSQLQQNETQKIAKSDAADRSNDRGPENIIKQLGVMPGDVFYAVNRETLNSDAPAPAGTAEILTGPLKGARVIGQFERRGGHLVFSYNQLVLKNGEQYNMTGFAVDPDTRSAGVRSDVDYHRLSRWGGLVAASFIEGFGEAVQTSGTSTSGSVTSGTIIKETPEYDAGEQAWIAAGKVGGKLSEQMAENFDTPPTVTLDANVPIGVLILSVDSN